MTEHSTIDEAIDSALDLLETDSAVGRIGHVVNWVTDNLICVLDEYRSGDVSKCEVGGSQVCRVADQIVVMTPHTQVMDSWEARRLAVALLRAAEAADQLQ